MHELAITKGIIDIVASEARDKGFTRVIEIRLRMGEYSGLVPECIREVFPIAAAGSPAEGAADRKNACCPRCRSTAVRMTAGREFYVDELKVE